MWRPSSYIWYSRKISSEGLEWPAGADRLQRTEVRGSHAAWSPIWERGLLSHLARTATIQIARIFENLVCVTGFNFMRNYVLAIPNWPNVPRCSQSFAFSPGALWFSWYIYILIIDDILYFPDRVSLWKPAEASSQMNWSILVHFQYVCHCCDIHQKQLLFRRMLLISSSARFTPSL